MAIPPTHWPYLRSYPMHAPLYNHGGCQDFEDDAHPPTTMHPPVTTHAPQQPHDPPATMAYPPQTMQCPPQPMHAPNPPSNHHMPPTTIVTPRHHTWPPLEQPTHAPPTTTSTLPPPSLSMPPATMHATPCPNRMTWTGVKILPCPTRLRLRARNPNASLTGPICLILLQ